MFTTGDILIAMFMAFLSGLIIMFVVMEPMLDRANAKMRELGDDNRQFSEDWNDYDFVTERSRELKSELRRRKDPRRDRHERRVH